MKHIKNGFTVWMCFFVHPSKIKHKINEGVGVEYIHPKRRGYEKHLAEKKMSVN